MNIPWLDYLSIRKSGLFNANYYLQQYPDVRKADIDPLWHFIKHGWREERNPGPNFNTRFYLESNPDVRQRNINPLIHYIKYGKAEGRQPSPGMMGATGNHLPGQETYTAPPRTGNIDQAGGGIGRKSLRRTILNGLYYLRVNGFREFIKKTLSKLGNPQTRVGQLIDSTKVNSTNNPFQAVYQAGVDISKGITDDGYVDFIERKVQANPLDVKLIAFYLPQYHPFPENDVWWGRGFTEWTNVSKAVPQFIGHYQPRLPGELGFYDLRVPEVQYRQVELAKNYGVHGFCFHYYWFNGKRLLERPLEQFMNDPKIDFPFCVCWANENWTRKWDGRSSDILISQEHSFEYDKLIVHDLVKLFAHPRYIHVDGRPLLIVYRADILQDKNATLDYWRKYSIQYGTGSPYILAAQTFGYSDPREDGFDGALNFPPHELGVTPLISDRLTLLSKDYKGSVYSYSDAVDFSISLMKPHPYSHYKTVMPGWDNEARRPGYGTTYTGSTPELYGRWLNAACRFTVKNHPAAERLVFINAWNEWGEAAYLEPDRKYGYAYLQATADVVDHLAQEDYNPQARMGNLQRDELAPNQYRLKVENISAQFPWYSSVHQAVIKKDQSELDNIILTIDNILASYNTGKVIDPEVSIIIPVFDHFESTLNCLKSLQAANEKTAFEVIVMDDGSTDETYEVLSRCKNIRYLRNDQNIGFLHSCNKAALSAKGKYLVLLNNDTIVLPGWLDVIMQTFVNNPNAGLIGSKLIYPDGRLQEAGGIIWNDANGTNFGREDNPDKPEYNYLREADYCSGACICVPRNIWDDMHGFDELFAPAYYEDADLAFRIRNSGYATLYQPFSRVIHLEGITSGTDTSSGIKHYQVVNREKFYARWKDVLPGFGTGLQPPIKYRNHILNRHALVIDVFTPKPDHDAGSANTYQYILILRSLGFEVTFISAADAELIDDYVRDLQMRGVECVYQPFLRSIEEYIKQNGKHFNIVFLLRAPYGGKYIDIVRKYAPQAKIVFHTVDLHFLREKRESELIGKGLKMHENVVKDEEISIMRKADISIVVSEYEQDLLQSLHQSLNTMVIQLPSEIPGRTRGFDGRKNIVFLGGYLHKPNIDAVMYFVKDIWPLITQAIPDCEFWIVGSNVPKELEDLAGEKIKVVGFVADLSQVFSECKLSIAPLRYGAGIKGKVITSLSYGVPCVASAIASEGMGLTHQDNILVADTPEDFAAEVVKLYTDRSTWERLSENGLSFVQENFSITNLEKNLIRLLEVLNFKPTNHN